MTILDRDLRYTWVYNTRHGFRPEQVLGKRADELIEPENAAEVIALQQEALWTRSTIRREIRGMTGDKLWVYDAVAEPVCTDTGEVVGLTFVVLDITERRRADEALRQSEERFRVAQDLSLDAFTILTAVRGDNGAIEDFRWQYVNSRAGTYLRHSPADLVGRRLLHVLPGNKTDSDLFSRYVRVVETGEPHDYELRYESEGISGWFRNMTVKLGDGIAVYFSDITGRKRAENALRRERDKAQQYLNIAETLILAIERDGTVSLINQKGCSILGYAEEDILGRNWFDHFLPEDQRDAIRELFDEIVKGRRQMVEQYENPVLAKDRRLRLISWHNSLVRDESGTISGMLCSGEDITDRKSAETALQESEERNRNLLNFTPLGMLLTRDNRIIWVNPAAVKLFRGLNEQELLAKAPADLFHAYRELLERHDRGLKRGVPVETQEEKIVTFDGTVREVEVTAVPFLDDQGSSILLMLNDVTLRKRAEAAHQQSEERLRALFEKAGDAIFMMEAEGEFAGHIFGANQAAADMHGYTVTELKTMNIKDLDSEDDAREVPARLKRMMSGEWLKCEITHRRKDGSVIPVEISTGLIVSGDQKFILGFDRDITERKKAEEALRESREQYQRLFHAISDGIVLNPLKSETQLGNFITANDTICRMLGYTEEEMHGLCFQDIILSEKGDVTFRDGEIMRTQGFHVHSKTLVTKTGDRIPVEISSRMFEHKGVQMALSVIRDITERKRTEDIIRRLNHDLRRRVSELETIFNTVPIGLAITHDPEGRQVRGNAAYLRAIGVSEDSTINDQAGESTFRVCQEERELSVDEHPMQRAVRGEVITGLILDIVRPDRHTVKLHCSAAPLMDEQGEPRGAVGAFLDITGLIRAEDEITNLNRDLQQNVRELRVTNKELEAFIYSVSHDLRAPLRSIKGFSDFLLHDYQASLDDRGKQYLDRVIKNTIKMDRLIDDLLHLSRISRQQLERVDVDLSRIVNELAAELKNAHPGRQVPIDIEEGLSADADPRLIKLALGNLLNNAWKFTLKTVDPRIAFGVCKKDGKPAYFLRDNGAGFDHNYADKLFLPFHRLHSEQEFEGSGIGLAIVERVVRRHGGRIWAEGRPDEGAVFYFTLHD